MPNILALIQETCDMVGWPRPSSVVGSADQAARQYLALLNEELDELHDAEWQRPTREQTFTTVAAEIQTGALPATFRSFVQGTFFNRSIGERIVGPLSPAQWQARKASPAVSGPYIAWRERDNAFLTTPIPVAGQTVAFEYLTDAKVVGADTVEKTAITADTDTPILNNKLIQLGLRWRFEKAKGLDYGEDMASYERRKAVLMAHDGGAPVLRLGSVDCRRGLGFVAGFAAGLSDAGIELEDGSNLLLEASAPV